MLFTCKHLKEIKLSSFNTKKVTSMHKMFGFCEELKEINLTSFNTENVTDMLFMFANCKKLNSIDLSSFNINKEKIFSKDSHFELDCLRELFDNLTYMSFMFKGCDGLTNIRIKKEHEFLKEKDIFPKNANLEIVKIK